MYEASLGRKLDLEHMESDALGLHLHSQSIRFRVCQQQLPIERRYKAVQFEATSFLQVQFKQNQFMEVRFSDCNFSDVVFRGCVFFHCLLKGSVFSNAHFQSCIFVGTEFSMGPIDPDITIRNCIFVGPAPLPKCVRAEQNWLSGSAVERPPAGFSLLLGDAESQCLPSSRPPSSGLPENQSVIAGPVANTVTAGVKAAPVGPASPDRFGGLEKD